MNGSEIAKSGFENEQDVANRFNNWKNDADAQAWLQVMMYNLEDIAEIHAERIGEKGFKSDVYVSIKIKIKKGNRYKDCVENLQIKLVSTKSGFNQVEKTKVEKYKNQWSMSDDVVRLLKLFDGETRPTRQRKDPRRLFANEFTQDEKNILLEWLQKNMIMIVGDVIRGRGRFAAEWTLVIHKWNGYRWTLKAVNEAVGIYCGDLKAEITSRGSFRLGNITLQRKGGDNGADSANMLQFKADPIELFDIK